MKWKVLKVDLIRAFYLPAFGFSVAGCFFVLLFNLSKYSEEYDVVYYFNCAAGGQFLLLLFLFAAMPYSGSCYIEIKTKYHHFFRLRTSKNGYLISKCIASFLSGFCVVACACILYVIIFSLRYPLFNESMRNWNGYVELLNRYNVIVYFVVHIGVLSFFGGTMSVIAFCISGIVTSVYAIWGFPVVLFYVWTSLGTLFPFPAWIEPSVLIQFPVMENVLLSAGYACFFFSIIMLVFMGIGFPFLRRKLTNE
jgi:hypothetical protein